MLDFKYYVLKNYRGLFIKKHTGNVHTIVAPTSIHESMYIVIIGEIVKEPNSFGCQLILRKSQEFVENVINMETNKYKDRYILVENLPCRLEDKGQGKYIYTFPKKGKYIRSDLSLTYEPEYSDEKTKIYVLRGNIDLETKDIKPKLFKMVGKKLLARLGRKG